MAKYQTSLKRKNAFFLNFDGRKLAKAIEDAGGNIKPALEAASRKSLPIVQKDFKAFAEKHEHSGKMEESLIDPSETQFLWGKQAVKKFKGKNMKGKKGFASGSVQIISEEDVLYFEYGFDAKKYGMPAMYLDVGTPKRTPKRGVIMPTYFIYYSVENNMDKIHAIQKRELEKIVESLRK